MSIASEISRLQSAKAAIKTSIEGKGVEVSSSATLDEYADYIDDIQQSGGSGVGEFTKYKKITGLPTASSYILASHNLGVKPKLIILSGDPQPETGDSTNYVKSGVYTQTEGVSRMIDGAKTAYTIVLDSTNNQVGYCYLTDSEVRINRATSARTFLTTCQYTVEMYA